MQFDLIVVGGGAAGYFCAINYKKLHPLAKVVIIEKTSKTLSKVKVSGGGRCNVTHHCFEHKSLSKNYPRGEKELLGAFKKFDVKSTIEWFKNEGVELQVESDGRMFPSTNDSQTIIDCFERLVQQLKIHVILQSTVLEITKTSNGNFELITSNEILHTHYVAICAGGSPKIEGFQIFTRLGHSIEAPVPSLFTFNLKDKSICNLMGVSVENVNVKIVETKAENTGTVLITHWGLSGPCILKLSAFEARNLAGLQYKYTVKINWLNENNQDIIRQNLMQYAIENPKKQIANSNIFSFVKRFWEFLLTHSEIELNKTNNELSKKDINKLIETITNFRFSCEGKTTYKEEFVTAGGIKRNEIDFNTMQSKKIPGLYFAGEIIDIDGVTGGFNFQAAWTTAYIAALNISKS
jgi:predicted Rossmann fold flavoprotein